MSSESECSCRVEGSGSQCNVLKQPNHQTVLVREEKTKTDREKEGETREGGRARAPADDRPRGEDVGETEEENGAHVNRETSACR